MASKELKLNQLIAICNGEKSRAQKILTNIYKTLDKEQLFEGISRKYEKIDEDGITQPPEKKSIQLSVKDAIKEAAEVLREMYNVVGSQDLTNCNAKANIEIEGKVIVADVPVTHLLFLEKQLEDLYTFVNSFPTLDPSEEWHFDEKINAYASEEKVTVKTKKEPRVLVKYEATKEHPAQVETYFEDVPIGYWHTIKFSGAIPKKDKDILLEKVRKLQKAIKLSREEANTTIAESVKYGDAILDYIFGK
jgi:hypothetical protein